MEDQTSPGNDLPDLHHSMNVARADPASTMLVSPYESRGSAGTVH